MKACICVISSHYLRELLQLPRDAKIVGIQDDIDSCGRILLKVEGAGFEVSPGMQLLRFTAKATTKTYTDLKWPFDEQTNP